MKIDDDIERGLKDWVEKYFRKDARVSVGNHDGMWYVRFKWEVNGDTLAVMTHISPNLVRENMDWYLGLVKEEVGKQMVNMHLKDES